MTNGPYWVVITVLWSAGRLNTVDSLGLHHKLPSTRTSHGWLSPTSSRLYLVDGSSPQKAVAGELKQTAALARPSTGEPSLNNLLENMPLPEKYALLLQSYATNIMDSTNRTAEAMNTMETLFTEMLGKSILPSEKSSKLLIDAASTFCNSIKLGKSLQLSKAGGSLRAFGAITGQMTVPITSASAWKAVMGDAKVPFDDREAEVWYAAFTVGAGVLWAVLQVGSAFVTDIQLYSTLFFIAALGLVGLDVASGFSAIAPVLPPLRAVADQVHQLTRLPVADEVAPAAPARAARRPARCARVLCCARPRARCVARWLPLDHLSTLRPSSP